MADFDSLFPKCSLIPVVVVQQVEAVVPLAKALLEGGIQTIEITLRSEAGLSAIEAIAKQVPDIMVGAGTVLSPEQMQQAVDAGAQFQVSPGLTSPLADYGIKHNICWLPGAVTASEIMQARQAGFRHVKFFPAAASGGSAAIKQLSGVFPDVRFCPTGGVSQSNLKDYALSSVFAVGGSWLAPSDALREKDWPRITQIAKESVAQLA